MSNEVILSMRGICMTFPGVKALNNVDFTLRKGEIHALMGENGAGKSTLIKCLTGVNDFEKGEIFMGPEQRPIRNHSTLEAQKNGIATVYQEVNLCPNLSVAENLFIGREPLTKLGTINHKAMMTRARELMKKLDIQVDVTQALENYSIALQQMIAIARAVDMDSKVLILDEPTSSLNEEDSRMLLNLLLDFKKQGMTSIIISHKLNEISYVADKITILRDGATIETIDNRDRNINEDRIIKGMVGREISDRYPAREHNVSDVVGMEVRDWNVYHPVYTEKKVVNNVSFNVHKGEIVGFSGLQGAGRTELAMSIFGHSYGADISGQLFINGKEVHVKNERQAIEAGLAYVTEDRKGNGLILPQTIAVNNTMARLDKVCSKGGIIDRTKENMVAEEYRVKLKTKTPSVQQAAGNLSGGNQQKVLLAKWMFADADVLILDEPTRNFSPLSGPEIRALLRAFPGAILSVSHDRKFIAEVCTRVCRLTEAGLEELR